MDAQELRNLQEAYMEVVANEAYQPFPKGKVDKKMASKAVGAVKHQVAATWGDQKKSSENQEKANKLGSQAKTMAQISTEKNKEANAWRRGVQSKHRSEVRRKIRHMDDNARDQRERGYGSTTKKEEVDLYDIILSHLLDEGYAETPEAAEVIMVNMSEEWREDIVEELTWWRKERALKKGGYLANRVAMGREGQPLERRNRSGDITMRTTTKGPTKRGGGGFKGTPKSDWYGTDDTHGSANKSKRRRGLEVKDTSDEV